MASASIRTIAAQRLLDLLVQRPGMLDVTAGLVFPGDEIGRDAVWLDRIEGSAEIPTSRAGRLDRDDTWTMTIEYRTTDHGTALDAMARIEELAAVLDGLLADDHTLGDLDGLLWATYGGMTNGPLPVQTPTGFVGFGEVVVSCRARLS